MKERKRNYNRKEKRNNKTNKITQKQVEKIIIVATLQCIATKMGCSAGAPSHRQSRVIHVSGQRSARDGLRHFKVSEI